MAKASNRMTMLVNASHCELAVEEVEVEVALFRGDRCALVGEHRKDFGSFVDAGDIPVFALAVELALVGYGLE